MDERRNHKKFTKYFELNENEHMTYKTCVMKPKQCLEKNV